MAHWAPVTGLTQALPADRVALPVVKVAVAAAVAAWPPPFSHALTLSCVLIAGRQVAVATQATLLAPVALLACALACHWVARRRALLEALARLDTGGRPPALVAGAVAVQRVAAAVAAALALVLAQRTPTVGLTGTLARGRVAAPIWVAQAVLTAVGGPELRRAGYTQKTREKL